MENIIKINIPENKVVKQIINSDGSINITFVDKKPTRSRSWKEFCINHPRITEEYYIDDWGSVSIITDCDRKCCNNLATKEDAEAIIALIQLTRLHDEWIGDWKPKFRAKPNAVIINTGNRIEVSVSCYCSALLLFPNQELAEEFLECFRILIEKAKKFI